MIRESLRKNSIGRRRDFGWVNNLNFKNHLFPKVKLPRWRSDAGSGTRTVMEGFWGFTAKASGVPKGTEGKSQTLRTAGGIPQAVRYSPLKPAAILFSGKQAFVLAAGLRLHVRNRTGLPVTGQMLFIPVLTRPLDS